MRNQIHNKQRGLTTVEYAVAGALIVAALIAAFTQLGGTVGASINDITSLIN